jgi:hypothetical protein
MFVQLNIPLSLPHVASSSEGAACGAYEDDPVPLRVHDCSIDLQILCDQRGVLCICHHYLYKVHYTWQAMQTKPVTLRQSK